MFQRNLLPPWSGMKFPVKHWYLQVWLKVNLDFIFLQKEYTCHNCQTLIPFPNILSLQ
jgi:hypothetical protein